MLRPLRDDRPALVAELTSTAFLPTAVIRSGIDRLSTPGFIGVRIAGAGVASVPVRTTWSER